MKVFLQHIVSEMKNYSKRLDQQSILIDKPWALIDSDFEIQKLIFKKNKELIMSKNGQVVMGSWEYLAEARSLLIDRGKDKILCNEAFINEGVMILKMDGTNNTFFILANENIVPDLDAYRYLRQLRIKALNIETLELTTGETLEVVLHPGSTSIQTGNRVTINTSTIPDGNYKIHNTNITLAIKDCLIEEKIYSYSYQTKDDQELIIDQKYHTEYRLGDRVWLKGALAPDGEYKIPGRQRLTVKGGKISELKMSWRDFF